MKCDKCKKEIPNGEGWVKVEAKWFNTVFGSRAEHVTICPGCAESVFRFMNGKAEET